MTRRLEKLAQEAHGSVARGEANDDSDLDLLVAWEPGRSLMDHAGLAQDLQELLGMKVHVGTEKSLHWYVRDRILREASLDWKASCGMRDVLTGFWNLISRALAV